MRVTALLNIKTRPMRVPARQWVGGISIYRGEREWGLYIQQSYSPMPMRVSGATGVSANHSNNQNKAPTQ